MPEKPTERQIVETWYRWLCYQYPDVARGTFHPPNEGKRTTTTCRILKSQGMLKGVADIIMLWPACGYHGACFEFKSAKGKLTAEQHAFLAHAKSCNYFVQIFNDIDTAIAVTNDYIKECL